MMIRTVVSLPLSLNVHKTQASQYRKSFAGRVSLTRTTLPSSATISAPILKSPREIFTRAYDADASLGGNNPPSLEKLWQLNKAAEEEVDEANRMVIAILGAIGKYYAWKTDQSILTEAIYWKIRAEAELKDARKNLEEREKFYFGAAELL